MPVNPYKNAFQNIEHSKEDVEAFSTMLITTGIDIVKQEIDGEIKEGCAEKYFSDLIRYMVNITGLQFLKGEKEMMDEYYKLEGAEARREFYRNKNEEIEEYQKQLSLNCDLLEERLDI